MKISGKKIFSVTHETGKLYVYRPDKETVEKTKAKAKEIFVEAFSTTYTDYFTNSDAKGTIEEWLRLKEGSTIKGWLEDTFDEEYEESWSFATPGLSAYVGMRFNYH